MRRLLILLALLPCLNAFSARAFIIDRIADKTDPSEPDFPAGPPGLTDRFDAAVIVATVPGQGANPTLFVFDVLGSPRMVLFLKNHYPANAFLGQSYSDLRALAATKPAIIRAIFRKLVSRSVLVNGQMVNVLLLVPQADATLNDVEIVHEIPANRFYGVSDGEDP